MKIAEEKMKTFLLQTKFCDSIYPVISNYSATPSQSKKTILENLSTQMSNKVKWIDSIRVLELNHEKNIIEIGPGKVLTGLIKRISKNFNYYNINEVKDIEEFKNAI